MKLHEEYQLYETLWDDSVNTTITEQLKQIKTETDLFHFFVKAWDDCFVSETELWEVFTAGLEGKRLPTYFAKKYSDHDLFYLDCMSNLGRDIKSRGLATVIAEHEAEAKIDGDNKLLEAKTDFINLYENLSAINEAYNIPYSGYVVVNEEGEYFSKEFLDTGNMRKAWTDDIREAAVYKDEDKAHKAKAYCFQLYDEKLDFFVKYVESQNELEQGEIERKLFEILKLWESFIDAGAAFQKLCNQDDFKNFDYSESAYKSKKPVPDLLIYMLTNDNNVTDIVQKLNTFYKEVIKSSNRADNDKELSEKATNFVQAWGALKQKVCQQTTSGIRLQIVELLKDM